MIWYVCFFLILTDKRWCLLEAEVKYATGTSQKVWKDKKRLAYIGSMLYDGAWVFTLVYISTKNTNVSKTVCLSI